MSILNLVDTSVSVAGNKIHFVSLELNQRFYEHHVCEVLVDFEELDERWMANPVSQIKLINESLSATMRHRLTGETNVFVGIITGVAFTGRHGAQSHILITAKSPTIKMDALPTMDSFVDKDLKGIIKEATAYSGNGVTIDVLNPIYKKPVNFVYQYMETCFQFLNRLCHNYGENFYYDGSKLVFGEILDEEIVFVKYESEMTDYRLDANLIPALHQKYTYLNEDDEKWIKETPPMPEDLATGYLKVAVEKSEEVYNSHPLMPLDASVKDSDSILDIAKLHQKRQVANMLVLSGRTQTCKIGIGKPVQIEFPQYMGMETTEGVFTVTSVRHVVDQKGDYHNEFSGVRQALKQAPMPPFALPVANPQQAKVVSNADPKNQGRVKVEFQWQKQRGKETNWIIPQTPDAGKSDKVSSNRGLVTIPEEGDELMIGFEFGNPDRPYSAGSIFTCKTGQGGGQGNRTKSLTTRSGNTIILDDDDNEGSITIKDPSGNIIVLDGNKNINVTAPETITINGKNMIFNIEEDITYNVSQNVTYNITESYTQNAKNKTINITENITETIEGKYTTNVTGNVNIDAKQVHHKTSGEYHVECDATVVISGSDEVQIK